MKGNCVIVVGPESTGSRLVAKICAHVLGLASFGDWDAVGWIENERHRVCHRSLPYGLPEKWPDVTRWVRSNWRHSDIRFILVTRDLTLSHLSRRKRFGKSLATCRQQSERARAIMIDIMDNRYQYLLWSYETFMFLGEAYLRELYEFLGVESSYCPELRDGNGNRLSRLIEPETRGL